VNKADKRENIFRRVDRVELSEEKTLKKRDD